MAITLNTTQTAIAKKLTNYLQVCDLGATGSAISAYDAFLDGCSITTVLSTDQQAVATYLLNCCNTVSSPSDIAHYIYSYRDFMKACK